MNFFSFNGNFYVAKSDDFGYINVYQFKNGYASPWQKVYTMPETQPFYTEGRVSVGVVNGGVFIAFRANDNSLGLLYSFDAVNWQIINMTGAGSNVLPGKPAMNSSPGVAIWNNFVYHAIYVTKDNKVYDVYWAWGWNGAELYRKTPSSTTQLTSLETKADAKMF